MRSAGFESCDAALPSFVVQSGGLRPTTRVVSFWDGKETSPHIHRKGLRKRWRFPNIQPVSHLHCRIQSESPIRARFKEEGFLKRTHQAT